MRSGLYGYTNDPEFAATLDADPTKVWTPQEVLAIGFRHPPEFPPGTAYDYSNTNYTLLGLIVEKVDGKPLDRAFQDRLFGPLGLQQTTLPASVDTSIPDPYSHGYMYGGSAFAMVDLPYPPDMQAAARAGTLQPIDYTNQNHPMPLQPGERSPPSTISPPGSEHWLPARCSTPIFGVSGWTVRSPLTRPSRPHRNTGTASSGRSLPRMSPCIITSARCRGSTPSAVTIPPTR
jgi:CubicO group peptidase (beta-lactamase class C family)